MHTSKKSRMVVYVVKAIWTVARPIEETVQLIWLVVDHHVIVGAGPGCLA